MCVYMYMCMLYGVWVNYACVCTCRCMCVYMYIVHVCCMYVYMYMCVYVHVCVCACVCTCMCVCVCVCTCTCMYVCVSLFLISSYGPPLAQRASCSAQHSSFFGPDDAVNYSYIVTNSNNCLLIVNRVPMVHTITIAEPIWPMLLKTYQKLWCACVCVCVVISVTIVRCSCI